MQNFNIWLGKIFHILSLLLLNVNGETANFHTTKIFALKQSKCTLTRGYLKLTESSNLFHENPIDRRKWLKLAGGSSLPKTMRIEKTHAVEC